MNTEQNYSEKGASTSLSQPTAQTAAKLPSQADQRRDYFHKLAEHPGTSEYLMGLLDSLDEFYDELDPIPLLTEVSQEYLTHPYYEPSPERIAQINQMLRLIRLLSQLRTQYTCFSIESQAALEKEGEADE